VGVASPGNVLRGSFVFNGEAGRGDHFAGVGTDDVATENLVGVLLDELCTLLSMALFLDHDIRI
jgi:hypothetical protein